MSARLVLDVVSFICGKLASRLHMYLKKTIRRSIPGLVTPELLHSTPRFFGPSLFKFPVEFPLTGGVHAFVAS